MRFITPTSRSMSPSGPTCRRLISRLPVLCVRGRCFVISAATHMPVERAPAPLRDALMLGLGGEDGLRGGSGVVGPDGEYRVGPVFGVKRWSPRLILPRRSALSTISMWLVTMTVETSSTSPSIAAGNRSRLLTEEQADGSSDTRQEILVQASRLFKRLGYRATTTREIAKAVNIKQPSLFHTIFPARKPSSRKSSRSA